MRHSQKGFTLIEILLVVAAIAILAGIVVVAVNPAKQLAATRDSERNSEVGAIAGALYQAQVGEVSLTIPDGTCTPGTAAQKLCTGAVVSTGDDQCGVTIAGAVPVYLDSVPTDPQEATANWTGYFIAKNATSGRITVCAEPETEGASTIAVTR